MNRETYENLKWGDHVRVKKTGRKYAVIHSHSYIDCHGNVKIAVDGRIFGRMSGTLKRLIAEEIEKIG